MQCDFSRGRGRKEHLKQHEVAVALAPSADFNDILQGKKKLLLGLKHELYYESLQRDL